MQLLDTQKDVQYDLLELLELVSMEALHLLLDFSKFHLLWMRIEFLLQFHSQPDSLWYLQLQEVSYTYLFLFMWIQFGIKILNIHYLDTAIYFGYFLTKLLIIHEFIVLIIF